MAFNPKGRQKAQEEAYNCNPCETFLRHVLLSNSSPSFSHGLSDKAETLCVQPHSHGRQQSVCDPFRLQICFLILRYPPWDAESKLSPDSSQNCPPRVTVKSAYPRRLTLGKSWDRALRSLCAGRKKEIVSSRRTTVSECRAPEMAMRYRLRNWLRRTGKDRQG